MVVFIFDGLNVDFEHMCSNLYKLIKVYKTRYRGIFKGLPGFQQITT